MAFWEGKGTECLWIAGTLDSASSNKCVNTPLTHASMGSSFFESLAVVILQQHLACEAEVEQKGCLFLFTHFL